MIKKRYLMILSLAVVSALLGSLFYSSITFSKEEEEPTPVEILNLPVDEEGNLKVKLVDDEVWQAINDLDSELDTLNASYLELLERVEMLENRMLPQGFVRAPAYDSGWITIPAGQYTALMHNLNTTELFVYVLGKDYADEIHQVGLNQRYPYQYSVRWVVSNSTAINIYMGDEATSWWDYVRVMIWKIQEPPT